MNKERPGPIDGPALEPTGGVAPTVEAGAAAPTGAPGGAEDSAYFVASQWQLIRWKFARHKLAVASLVFLGLMYASAVFAPLLSPNAYDKADKDYMLCPPTRIRFFDESGRFHLRPFVYGMERSMNPDTLIVEFATITHEKHPIRLFIRGDEYDLLGFIPLRIRMFGVETGKLYLFGADSLGRDVYARVLKGAQISLSIGFVGIVISFLLGILLGGLSGYIGGVFDTAVQRLIEFLNSIPTIPLWMVLGAVLPRTWPVTKVYFSIVVILSLLSWTSVARVVRGKFLSLREEDFVLAARLYNAGTLRLIFSYMLPSFYSYIIARLTLTIPAMILGETALSFIGLGLRSPAVSWGVLLQDAHAVSAVASAPWLLIPGIFVILTILAFNFVGDGMRDAADPYSQI